MQVLIISLPCIIVLLFQHAFCISGFFSYIRLKRESRSFSPLTFRYSCIILLQYPPFCAASPRENSLSCKVACALSQGYKAKRVGKRIAGMCYYVGTLGAKYVGWYIKVACFAESRASAGIRRKVKSYECFLILLLTRVTVEQCQRFSGRFRACQCFLLTFNNQNLSAQNAIDILIILKIFYSTHTVPHF